MSVKSTFTNADLVQAINEADRLSQEGETTMYKPEYKTATAKELVDALVEVIKAGSSATITHTINEPELSYTSSKQLQQLEVAKLIGYAAEAGSYGAKLVAHAIEHGTDDQVEELVTLFGYWWVEHEKCVWSLLRRRCYSILYTAGVVPVPETTVIVAASGCRLLKIGKIYKVVALTTDSTVTKTFHKYEKALKYFNAHAADEDRIPF